ncbi:MAG TPA: DUF2089 domain-containing protein [Candidatus Aminicenantes bacterium]|nr:DUF2089 domain-containing protein [Candidatus Aminicenantes bacterium]
MTQDWQELTKLTRGEPFTIEKVKLVDRDISIEGGFTLPPLAMLRVEDQLFVAAFIRSHGSIKEMEALFGISYPTVKNRLNAISAQLPFVDVNPPSPGKDVLDQLDKGEISVEEALARLKG